MSSTIGTITPQSFVVTTSDKLSSLGVKNGQEVYVKDKGKIYYDWDNKRKAYHDVIELATNADRLSLEDPYTNKLYIVMENCTLWQYDGTSWHSLITEPSVIFVGSEGFPTIGNGSVLYVSGTQLYKYDTNSKAYVEIAKDNFVWGNF